MVLSELWESDDPGLRAARIQLVFSQVMTAFRTCRRLLDDDARQTASETLTFHNELTALADEVMDIHDAEFYATPFLGFFVRATDDSGQPAEPSDLLAHAYIGPTVEIVRRLGDITSNVIQRYRITKEGLDEILPTACPEVRELMLVLARMIGLSSDKMLAWYPDGLKAYAGCAEYLADDWEKIVRALREEGREKGQGSLETAVRGILANMGLYVDDLEDGRRDVLVGTPRLIMPRCNPDT